MGSQVCQNHEGRTHKRRPGNCERNYGALGKGQTEGKAQRWGEDSPACRQKWETVDYKRARREADFQRSTQASCRQVQGVGSEESGILKLFAFVLQPVPCFVCNDLASLPVSGR